MRSCAFRTLLLLALLTIVPIGLACSAGSRLPQATEIPNPAGPGSGMSHLTVAPDGSLLMSWVEPEGDGHALRFARWKGEGWGESREIARGTDWFVNWADFPGLVALPDGTLLAHWLAKVGAGTYAYGIQVTRSSDGGATWSDPVSPHHDGTESEHGFVSWTVLPDGRAMLAWLDGRETVGGEESGAEPGPGDEHGHGGAMTLRASTFGADGTQGEEVLLDTRVCDCCNTDIAADEDGSVLVVYRDRSEEEIRDIAAARFDGTMWSEGIPVHEDGWKIHGCPVNGPAIARSGNLAVTAWFTVTEGDVPHVRTAFSEDGGRSFGAPVELGGSDPLGRVDVVLTPEGTAWVSWLETTGPERAEIRIRSVGADGRLGEPVVVATTSNARASGFPRLAQADEAFLVSWTDPGEPGRVRTAIVR